MLGKFFVRRLNSKLLVGKIIEVEAYCQNDPASHSFRGPTKRNEVMFKEGGHLYVYFTYGMHFCANIVTGVENRGEAVLLRALEPIVGVDVMIKNRFPGHSILSHRSLVEVSNGPAKLCKAFGITKNENGIDLTAGDCMILQGDPVSPRSIGRSSRIGIQVGIEKQWRFFIKKNLWVSR